MLSLVFALALTTQCPNGQCSRAVSLVAVPPAPTVVARPAPGFYETRTVVRTQVRTRPRLFGGLFRGACR